MVYCGHSCDGLSYGEAPWWKQIWWNLTPNSKFEFSTPKLVATNSYSDTTIHCYKGWQWWCQLLLLTRKCASSAHSVTAGGHCHNTPSLWATRRGQRPLRDSLPAKFLVATKLRWCHWTLPHWCVCVELVHFLRQMFHCYARWQCPLWCGDPLREAAQIRTHASSKHMLVDRSTSNNKRSVLKYQIVPDC